MNGLRCCKALEWLKRRAEGEGLPALYFDFCQLIFHRLKEFFRQGNFSSPPARKVFRGSRAVSLQVKPDKLLERQLCCDGLPGTNPRFRIDECDALPLTWSEAEITAIGRWFQGRTPVRSYN